MKRKASAVWMGGIKDGRGRISTDSGVLRDTQYSFATRFENGVGTNPEELIAAAHAGCFSMALSAQLGNAGLTAEKISTTASVTLDKVAGGFGITAVHLDVSAKVPGADQRASPAPRRTRSATPARAAGQHGSAARALDSNRRVGGCIRRVVTLCPQ